MAFAHVVTNIRDAVETPLTQPLDTVHLFLIVGIVLVSFGFWSLVLSHLREILPVE